MCETKPDQKVEYLFNLPMNKFLEVQNQVKHFLVKKDEDLKQDFLTYKVLTCLSFSFCAFKCATHYSLLDFILLFANNYNSLDKARCQHGQYEQ